MTATKTALYSVRLRDRKTLTEATPVVVSATDVLQACRIVNKMWVGWQALGAQVTTELCGRVVYGPEVL